MSQYRSREADKRATCQLELVHCDLSGPIDPVAREGFRYAISFVDDYSGIIMVYFLKCKRDSWQIPFHMVQSNVSGPTMVLSFPLQNLGHFLSRIVLSMNFQHHIHHIKMAQ